MRPTVRIAFDLALGGGGDFFTLDDPVKGTLDTAPFGLGGEAFVDVTGDVRSVQFRRGRSSETQTVDAAGANVVLDNRQRLYDPLVSASISPYAPSIIPRKALVVELANQRVFTGQVEDWDLQYAQGGDSVSIAKTADAFALLSQEVYTASVATASALSGSAIYDAASVAGWPLGRLDLDAGTSTIGANTIDAEASVLQYLQQIEATENGLLFINREGALAFRDRTSAFIRSGVRFSDNGSGFPFFDIEIEYGTEFLFTRLDVEFLGGRVFAEDLTASEDYGLTTLRVKTLFGTQEEAEDFATFLVDRYRQPTVRIRSLQVQVDALTVQQQALLVGLDIGDIVSVEFTPNGIGEPILRELAIDSIEHSIVPGGHIAKFTLFEPFLRRFSGSVFGSSSTAGFVLGVKGKAGSVFGSSGTAGSVVGVNVFTLDFSRLDSSDPLGGALGSIIGVNGSTGTVTGVIVIALILDTGLLDTNGLG
jgi:hypothetical protein